ncbi:MAG: type II secretion system inner membrane protein GspF [Polyangiales bacterium]
MAVFQWQGIDARGKDVKGIRDADNPRLLRVLLRKEGILATAIEEEAAARTRTRREIDFGQIFQRVSVQDVAITTRQLATLLRAGVPLVESLSALIEQVDHLKMRAALTQTRDKVNEGTSLADALKAHPKIFESLYVNMVAAGESSGTLDSVLERLADHLDASSRLRDKVVSALAYPAFMVVFGIAIISLLMVVVVPKVTTIFEGFNATLPWYTQTLIFVSHAFADFWWLLLLLFGGAVYGFRRWRATEKGRAIWDARVLTLPLMGPLVLMVAVARFSRTLSTLLASGVPVLTALDITRNVLGNAELMRVVEDARGSIREGESIAAPLKRSGRFPPIVTQMIAIGERSGQLEQMLNHVAIAYEGQVDARLAALTSLLGPLMIVVMGAIAGSIALSILLPLMQMGELVQ